MKQFKVIDYWISLVLIVAFFIYGFVKQDSGFIIGYFVVGGWQLISIIVHSANNWFFSVNSSRSNYTKVIIWIGIIILLSFFSALLFNPIGYLLLIELLVLLIAAPLMAIYYTIMCYEEVYVKMKRPLAFLK